MIIDIVPYNSQYRGMGRMISVEYFNSPKARKNFRSLYKEYFSYIENFYFEEEEIILDKILPFYNLLIENEVKCEMILYSNNEKEQLKDYKMEFLGIDIVKDMCESLIWYNETRIDKLSLNRNGLCENIQDVKRVITLLNEDVKSWKPCWIYKIII